MGWRNDADFLVFVYEGGGEYSWAVDSYLLTETHLGEVLSWLKKNLPVGCCWSLGVVQRPRNGATVDSELDVAWIVGADVLNDGIPRSPEEEQLAQEMLTRRHHVDIA